MNFIDLHCDTLMYSYLHKTNNIISMPDCMVDIDRMTKSNSIAQFFAIFLPPIGIEKKLGLDKPIDDIEYFLYLHQAFENTLKFDKRITFASDYDSLMSNINNNLLSGFLTLEDGRIVEGKHENIEWLYNKGIRLITLTWNEHNCFGAPNSKDKNIMNEGLTDFGKDAISFMNDLGIIIDVSHLSDGGFWDVYNISKKPFVASHSNCRTISPHQRNLTDDMIKAIANSGGTIGINFGPEFLNEDITNELSSIDQMIEHIDMIKNLGGIDSISLGSDFDGISGKFEISSIDKMHLLFDRLSLKGYTDDEIEKIAFKNVLRVIKDTL